METIKFTLSGRNGMFKKPDVNEKIYFTYNNIHKVALLGILGAIIGLPGYRNKKIFSDQNNLPEFYRLLSPLKIAIVPLGEKGYFAKKKQYFNNGVGYASKEEGGNLQVFEQWLEYPSWTIYIANTGMVAQSVWEQLKEYLLQGKCMYIPYLGKNDFPATIDLVELVWLEKIESRFVHSLFLGDVEMIDVNAEDTYDDKRAYIFMECAPIALQEQYGFYRFATTVFTNTQVHGVQEDLWQDRDKILYFF